MAAIDPHKERQRLARLYAQMSDLELQTIAADLKSLTDVAKEAMDSELNSRGVTFNSSPPKAETGTKNSVEARDAEEDKSVPSGPLVMVKRLRNLPEATVAKSMLDSAQIDSYLADENTIRIDWFWSNLLGGIKLMVRPEDQEAAANLLAQEIPDSFDVEGQGIYAQPRCPVCSSLDVSFEELDKKVAYSALLIGLPVVLSKKGWNCHSCNHDWEEPEEGDSPKPQNSEWNS